MSSFIPNFLWSQLFVTPPESTASFEAKTIIVTGGNAGLGLEAARSLVQHKATKVILAVRNTERGAAAKADIESSTQCSTDTVLVWHLDMSSYDSVKRFADRVKNETLQVDAVVLNAGVAPRTYEVVEGDESAFAINFVSTFLLALLILPALRNTAQKHGSRTNLTIVGSDVHMFARFPEANAPPGKIFDALNQRDPSNVQGSYATSKLLQLFGTRALAKQLGDSSLVVVNNVTPGLCHSDMTKQEAWIPWLLLTLLGRKRVIGARTIVTGVASGHTTHGQYMQDGYVMTPGKMVVNQGGPALQQAVWEELCTKLEGISPGVTKNI